MMGFRQKMYDKKDTRSKYISLELEFGTVELKRPSYKDIDNMGLLIGKVENFGGEVLQYTIDNLYEKNEQGELEKVFTIADRDMLESMVTPLHKKVMEALTEEVQQLSPENVGK